MNGSYKKLISLFLLLAFATVTFPVFGADQENLGQLRGFVYGDDGKKPLTDAVVLIRDTVTQIIYRSEKTKKNGAYKIPDIVPGSYAVGIQYKKKDYNVDALLEIKSKKQMACFTLPKLEDQPGYMIRCKSPKCFFILPVGWALVAGVTTGVVIIIKKIVEKEKSPTGI